LACETFYRSFLLNTKELRIIDPDECMSSVRLRGEVLGSVPPLIAF